MTIKIGERLPDAELLHFDENGPGKKKLAELVAGKKAVIFGVPGAYTRTCTSAHMPSFVKNAEALRSTGVDEIICVSVNDPFVMAAWGVETGADKVKIHTLGDADSAFTKAIGLDFTVSDIGFLSRSQRYAMVVDDGVVTHINIDENPGECNLSAAESILELLSS